MPDFATATDLRAALRKLTEKEKETLLLRSVRRDAEWRATLAYELLPDVTREVVYETVADRIHDLLTNVSGHQLARYLTKAVKKATDEITYARRITGERGLEIDLYAYLVRQLFARYSGQLDASYSPFFKTVARHTRKLTELIRKYLHEDVWLDYQPEVEAWLGQLHHRPHRVAELPFELPRHLPPAA